MIHTFSNGAPTIDVQETGYLRTQNSVHTHEAPLLGTANSSLMPFQCCQQTKQLHDTLHNYKLQTTY